MVGTAKTPHTQETGWGGWLWTWGRAAWWVPCQLSFGLKSHLKREKGKLGSWGTDVRAPPLNNFRILRQSLVWWYMPVIPSLERWRQEDQEFKTSLGFKRLRIQNKIKNNLEAKSKQTSVNSKTHVKRCLPGTWWGLLEKMSEHLDPKIPFPQLRYIPFPCCLPGAYRVPGQRNLTFQVHTWRMRTTFSFSLFSIF